MNPVIGSHIIPKFYLNQFGTCSPKGGKNPWRIWVYQREKEPYQSSTASQGAENGYFGFTKPDGSFDESFESELADRENECNDVLASAKSFLFDWSTSHRNKLAFYMGMLHSRAIQRRGISLFQIGETSLRNMRS